MLNIVITNVMVFLRIFFYRCCYFVLPTKRTYRFHNFDQMKFEPNHLYTLKRFNLLNPYFYKTI